MVCQSWALNSTSTFLLIKDKVGLSRQKASCLRSKDKKQNKKKTTHHFNTLTGRDSLSLMKWWRHVVVPVPGDSLGPCVPFFFSLLLVRARNTTRGVGRWRWRDHVRSDLWTVSCHTRACFLFFLLLLPHDFLQPVASLSAQTANCFSISLISQTIKNITSIIFSKALYTQTHTQTRTTLTQENSMRFDARLCHPLTCFTPSMFCFFLSAAAALSGGSTFGKKKKKIFS